MSRVKLLTAATSALFLLLVSAALGYSELYIMSAAILSVPLVSYVLGRICIRRLRCARSTLEYAREGEPFQVRLELLSRSSILGPIEIEDRLPEWIVRQDQRLSEVDHSTVSYTAVAKKRGEYMLGPVRLHASDPLGFFRFRCRYPLTSTLIVLPKALMIPELSVRPMGALGEYQFDGTGARGSGVDFHGIREYQTGDELRRIHWRSTAKHNRLNVIEFEHSRAEDAVIAIDLRRGSEVGRRPYSSLEYAVRIAAGIIEQTLTMGSTARLACAGVEGPARVSGRGFGHLHVLLEALARIQADRDESLSDVLLEELDNIKDNTAVICLGPAIDEGMGSCARLLSSRGIKLQFILVSISDEAPHQQLAGGVMAAGVSLVVVDCSTDTIEAKVRYEHAA